MSDSTAQLRRPSSARYRKDLAGREFSKPLVDLLVKLNDLGLRGRFSNTEAAERVTPGDGPKLHRDDTGEVDRKRLSDQLSPRDKLSPPSIQLVEAFVDLFVERTGADKTATSREINTLYQAADKHADEEKKRRQAEAEAQGLRSPTWAEIRRRDEKIAQLGKDLARRDEDLDRARENLDRAREQVNILDAEIDQHLAQLEAMGGEITKLHLELVEQQVEIDLLRRQVKEQQAEIDRLRVNEAGSHRSRDRRVAPARDDQPGAPIDPLTASTRDGDVREEASADSPEARSDSGLCAASYGPIEGLGRWWRTHCSASELTGYSFLSAGQYTTLRDELTNIQRHLAIERAWLEGRLRVRLRIARKARSALLPLSTLQPLVENAVRYGLDGIPSGGTIIIRAKVDWAGWLVVSIEDDGAGLDPEEDSGALVALRDVDSRLRLAFGEDCGLVVETAIGAGMMVTMRVPSLREQGN